MGDADGMTHDGESGMTHDGMTHDGDKMVYVYGMTHDDEVMTHADDAAVADMFYNDNGISASAHSNNSVLTNCMGVVNKTLP